MKSAWLTVFDTDNCMVGLQRSQLASQPITTILVNNIALYQEISMEAEQLGISYQSPGWVHVDHMKVGNWMPSFWDDWE